MGCYEIGSDNLRMRMHSQSVLDCGGMGYFQAKYQGAHAVSGFFLAM